MTSILVAIAICAAQAPVQSLPDEVTSEQMDVYLQLEENRFAEAYSCVSRQCDQDLANLASKGNDVAFRKLSVVCDIQKRTALRRETGMLIDHGECDRAVATALQEGDLVVAGEVKSFCGRPK